LALRSTPPIGISSECHLDDPATIAGGAGTWQTNRRAPLVISQEIQDGQRHEWANGIGTECHLEDRHYLVTSRHSRVACRPDKLGA
jgi:hypothetical protein